MRKLYTLLVSVGIFSILSIEAIAQLPPPGPAPLWTRLYAGPTGKGAIPRLIKVVNGSVYVAGSVNSTSNTNAGIEVLKYDLSGGSRQVIAKNTLATSVRDFEVDASGNIYITGVISAELVGSGIPNDNFVTMKYNANGSLAWATTYAGSLGIADQSRALAVDNSGNVFVTGFADGEPVAGGNAVLTIKYSSSGQELWTAKINEIADLFETGADREEGSDITVDEQGDVYITGQIGATMFVAKYAGSYSGPGNPIVWKKMVSEGSNGKKVFVKNGNVVASGFGGAVVSFSLDGILNWVQKYSEPGSTREADYWTMTLDDVGNIYAAGSYNSDFFTIKYNSAGIKQWDDTYGGTANVGDFARNIAIDGAGNVYVTGYLSMKEGRNNVTKIPVVKYNSAGTGTPEWAALMNGDGFDIATDPTGAVYVTGQQVVKNIRNFSTTKYPCCIAQTVSPFSTLEESGLNNVDNFPNPFKSSTNINFRLAKAGYVSLNVFDLNGRRIQTLVQGQKNAGQHSVKFSGNNLPAGTYIYRLEADGYSKTGRMILEK